MPSTSDSPPTLRGEPRKIWEIMAPKLCRLGLLTELDRHHLSRACRLEALGIRLLRRAEKEPIATTKSNGRQPSGEFTAALRAFEAADRWWARFGISPAERTRIKVDGDSGKEDQFKKFLARKKTR